MTNGSRLREDRVLLLDGGTGSELRRRGVKLSTGCWSAAANLSHPNVLKEIHRDYVLAGADIITANTFATSRFALAAADLDHCFDEINLAAVGFAREAADSTAREVAVAASLSCFPPAFDSSAYPEGDVEFNAYAELCSLFREAGADLLLLEMMQDTEHAVRACRAASQSGLPYWIGISCRLNQDRQQLVSFDRTDQRFTAIVEALVPFEPEGIAVMHSPPDAIGPALEVLRRRWPGPIGAYAEITYPEDPDAITSKAISPEDYAQAARHWLREGAVMLGGCCGTSPAHIKALRVLIDG
jgi:homocysteine S-methyltransferase